MSVTESMTAQEALGDIARALQPVAQECASHEAEEILQFLFGCSRSELYLSWDRAIPDELRKKLQALVRQRIIGWPLPYVLGTSYFHSMAAAVNSDVLIPRPDTEVLVQTVLDCEGHDLLRFADIGTGSGVIAGVLVRQRPSWYAVATDISFEALRVARVNAMPFSRLVLADKLTSFKPDSLDFIVSNPPYIADTEMVDLDASVREFEPTEALRGGPDGLAFYRDFARTAPPLLVRGGRIYCEIGATQQEQVCGLLADNGWTDIRCIEDLGGRPRVIAARTPLC